MKEMKMTGPEGRFDGGFSKMIVQKSVSRNAATYATHCFLNRCVRCGVA
jgi:hypothetical protein